MIVVVCVDDRWGMSFHNRRQSRDSAVTVDLLAMSGESLLYVHPRSAELFAGMAAPHLRVEEAHMDRGGPGDYCLVENVDPTPLLPRAEGLVIYHWNRRYPADLYFTPDLTAQGWRLAERREFSGTSHERMTREVYTK